MIVTPVGRKFGKYKPGDIFELPDRVAKVFVKIKKLEAVDKAMTYQTRALTADVDSAGTPWDASLHTSTKLQNADGTWRKRPSRAKTEES